MYYLLVAILSLSLYSGQNQKEATNYKEQSSPSAQSTFTPTPPVQPLATPQRQEPPDQKKETPHNDSGSWFKPEWWMVILTAIYVVLTAVYVRFSGSTLNAILRQEKDSARQFTDEIIETRKSADAAKDSAEATRGIVATLRDGNERQLRAYVLVDSGTIFNVADPVPLFLGQIFAPSEAQVTNKAAGPGVRLFIKNTGQTPAYDVRHWGHICFREFPLKNPLPARPPQANPVPSILGREIISTKLIYIPNPLSSKEVADLRVGAGAVYVYGEITYRDTFGKSWYTHYRLMYHPYGGAIGVSTDLTFCDGGNEAT